MFFALFAIQLCQNAMPHTFAVDYVQVESNTLAKEPSVPKLCCSLTKTESVKMNIAKQFVQNWDGPWLQNNLLLVTSNDKCHITKVSIHP